MQKWDTTNAGPRQVADFQKAWEGLSWEGKTFTQLTGTHGHPASEHRAVITKPFGIPSADVIAIMEDLGEAHGWTLTKDTIRSITAEVAEATVTARAVRPVRDERITAEEKAERDARMAERDARMAEPLEAQETAWAALQAKAPAGAHAVILAELEEDTSDIMTDYFSNRTVRQVAIGWRYGKREDFKQLRAAAASFPDTAHLDNKEAEHRDNWSMGKGNYLGTGNSGSGWCVRSYDLKWRVGPGVVDEEHLPDVERSDRSRRGR